MQFFETTVLGAGHIRSAQDRKEFSLKYDDTGRTPIDKKVQGSLKSSVSTCLLWDGSQVAKRFINPMKKHAI